MEPHCHGSERFLQEVVVPVYEQGRAQLRCSAAIRQQAHGQSLDPERACKLQAYDLRLDRQLERTLAMLLKLQETRRTIDARQV